MFQANRLIFLAIVAAGISSSPSLALARERGTVVAGDVDPKTGMKFPPRAGAFERKGRIEYDDAGYPVGHYFAGTLGYATVFYYKNLPFAQEYATARDAVIQKTPAARLISDGPSILHSGG